MSGRRCAISSITCGQFDESKAQALFETSAEVLVGLDAAFSHYEGGTEAAMREPS